MKIVITGALGHIGSRLIRTLPVEFPDAEISLIDNLSTQRYASLFNLPASGTYRFFEADVTSADLEPYLIDADAVVHLAAIVDAASSFDHPDEVMRVNFSATRRVAEACARYGVSMVFPSSTSVYGTQKDQVDETCGEEDLKPQSPYAESKLREENLLEEMARTADLKVAICRFGTIFGTSPGMRFHTAINKFCWQAAVGTPLSIWRTAYDQKRPYLELGDCCRAIAFIISGGHFDGRIYNVLTTNATVGEIVDLIKRRRPSLHLNFVDSPIMNQLSYEVSCERFKSQGFRFQGNLASGCDETLQYLAGIIPATPVISEAAAAG